VLLVGATGFGKTATASAIMASAVARGKRCAFVVHRREIVLDTARRLREQGLRTSVVMAGEPFDPEAQAYVCSIQTIAARALQIPADLVVWDEAHHVAAGTYAALREQYPQAWHLGLTATPVRADGAGLSDAFDALVVGATVRELQERGALVGFDALVPAQAGKGFAQRAEFAYNEYARGRAAVIFCGTVERGREVAAATALPLIHGGTKAEERDACLRAFAQGEVPGVVNVMVLTEGWDCARADCVILERNCGSVGTYLQIVGRILRANPADPKKRALLIDLGNNVLTHGLPSDDREYSLDGKPIRRTETEQAPLCAMCGATRRDGDRECWRCGVVYPQRKKPVVRNVGLVDFSTLSPEDRVEMEAAHLRGLERTAEQRGYKAGWVAHRFHARWGRWPERRAS
jgi:superfamily II DNA or RNA helicase